MHPITHCNFDYRQDTYIAQMYFDLSYCLTHFLSLSEIYSINFNFLVFKSLSLL